MICDGVKYPNYWLQFSFRKKKRMHIIHEQHYHKMQQAALIPGMLQRTQTSCGTDNSTEIQPYENNKLFAITFDNILLLWNEI